MSEAPSGDDPTISPLLRDRRSIRAFDTERAVSEQVVTALIAAASSAPSAFNYQPWRLWIARRGTRDFDALLGTLEPYNALWAHRAGLLVVSIAVMARDGQQHPWAMYDLGQAMAMLTVEATRRGLGLCQMAGRDVGAIGDLVSIAPQEEVAIVTAVGYPGAPVELEPDTAALERNAPLRRPASEAATVRL